MLHIIASIHFSSNHLQTAMFFEMYMDIFDPSLSNTNMIYTFKFMASKMMKYTQPFL